MYLVWLRVAAVLYAVASLTALPAVLYAFPRWRKVCLPAAGLAFLFHLVSVTEMLGLAHRYFPVGYSEVESLLGLAIVALFLAITRIYGTLSFGIFALPASFLLVFVPALGAGRYTISFGRRADGLAGGAYFFSAGGVCFAGVQHGGELSVPGAGAAVEESAVCDGGKSHISGARCGAPTPSFVPIFLSSVASAAQDGFAAAAGHAGADCALDAAFWFSLHDAGAAGGFCCWRRRAWGQLTFRS